MASRSPNELLSSSEKQPLCQANGSSSGSSYYSAIQPAIQSQSDSSHSPGTSVSPGGSSRSGGSSIISNRSHNSQQRLGNGEYPIRRHCFRDCSEKIFRNRKKCVIISFTLAFIFMAIFIVCILRITEMYYQFGEGDNNTKELFIPVESVVEVNFTSLNISTKHANKLNVTALNKNSLIQVSMDHAGHRIPLLLNTNITLEKGQSKSLLRY
ncbi:PREDICTED: uncharacterized protein LOC109593711 [Amphimedon queenslandica]|uniref:Uncharacterized protein n=1 Tax=Amphimedon queenslandica TaxID=400682 RepID=A0AAN0K4W8_AMPQE|nr:PREDICTED: uncharacterized protein LOC109593711 [Amphimedon queenslandica]|eukprot:XP_019864239.1 PREDICTED: uncharacterized protein LOC109593711 [Amphimedon queenslandica]